MMGECDVIIYHGGCIDGWCAAWVGAKRYPHAELRAVMHGTPPPTDLGGRHVLMLDFCYPRADMVALCRAAASVRVLDHHVTAREALEGLAEQMAAEGRHADITFDMYRSGCGLAWDKLFGWQRAGGAESWSPCVECHGHLHGYEYHDPGCPSRAPWVVRYIEDRDLWRWALPHSREVNAYIATLPFGHIGELDKAENLPLKIYEWDKVEKLPLKVAIERGGVALAAQRAYVDAAVSNALPRVVAGHEVPSVNAIQHNISEVLELLMDIYPGAPFVHGWWQRGDGMFANSLRSRGEVDVSRIAQLFGGGGHKNAAGYQTQSAPCSAAVTR